MPPQGAGARPLPKFGEWDVNNPESAEGFTVIFSKARDQKKSSGSAVAPENRVPGGNNRNASNGYNPSKKDKKPSKSKSWVCCFYGSNLEEAERKQRSAR